ncbi:MAG: YggS family pyridoxal phosphate-dependent enzyme [Candidatus Omnitrophota bacterium]
MKYDEIARNVKAVLAEIPDDVRIVAAAKSRTPDEILAAIDAGIKIVGENYIQDSVEAFNRIGNKIKWHFIGHLQKNKIKKAVEIFDVIETVDSFDLAEQIDMKCAAAGRSMEVFIEINSGKEPQKSGVLPENSMEFIKSVSALEHIKIRGLMTMGPFSEEPEDARPYFAETKKIFDSIRSASIPGVEMKYLSMGMTNSYRVAVEEGANMIRIGTRIFGKREIKVRNLPLEP